MLTSFDILDRVYSILNTETVCATIDGGIYRIKRPLDSSTRDLVIVMLPISGGAEIQEGVFFIDCYAPKLQNGQPDEVTLRATVNAVISAIQGYSASNEFFTMEITTQDVLDDDTNSQWNYASIRVNYLIQNM